MYKLLTFIGIRIRMFDISTLLVNGGGVWVYIQEFSASQQRNEHQSLEEVSRMFLA